MALHALQADVHAAAVGGAVPADLLDRVGEAAERADVEYLQERVPVAFERARDGISRVATIVGAMREFAHPPTAERAAVDVNEALQNTLIVAANAYKYVADVDIELGELPEVMCNGGDINQVFLNLIVNAAHAIEDRGDGARGTIRIRTRAEADHVVITIADTGCGIPADVAGRVFDPFFTTKEVGRGTGQGLAIARTLVVERHGGTLTFETDPGSGTTFDIRLPIGHVADGTGAAVSADARQ
jgi:two-component system, NtrC family, sensor kinase